MAFVLDEITNPRAGTEQQLLMLLDCLDRDVVAPSVTVLRSSSFVARWPVPECPVSSLDISRVTSPSALVKLGQFAWRLRRDRVNIVHILFNDAAVVAPVFARLGGATVIAARRDLGFWHTPYLLKLLRVSNRFVERIVVNSEAVLHSVARAEQYPQDRIILIRNGFDESRLSLPAYDLRRELGIGEAVRLVGMVANLHLWKRHGDLIQAIARLSQQGMDIHAVLIGEGPERGALASLAVSLGVEARTHFVGSILEPIPHIKALDVAVLASETEGASNALIEYLCCGVPLVLTDIPANREVALGMLETARFYDAGDIQALATAVEQQLHGQPGPRCSGTAVDMIKRFSSRRMAAQYMELYRGLSGSKADGHSNESAGELPA